MSIAVLTAHPVPHDRSVAREMIEFLRTWGIDVEEMRIDQQGVLLQSLEVRHDIYLLTSATSTMISVATALESKGARFLNHTDVVRICRDRVLSAGLLSAQGVPVPESWAAEHPRQLAGLLDDGPIVLKHTTAGAGSQVVWDLDELIHLQGWNRPVFAQRFHASEHRDRKVYRIGDQIFGVKRSRPTHAHQVENREAFTIDAQLRDITVRIGEVLGTDLYGFDVVLSDDRPYVVDIHPFPEFKGVPDAALRLADYVYALTCASAKPAIPIERAS